MLGYIRRVLFPHRMFQNCYGSFVSRFSSFVLLFLLCFFASRNMQISERHLYSLLNNERDLEFDVAFNFTYMFEECDFEIGSSNLSID